MRRDETFLDGCPGCGASTEIGESACEACAELREPVRLSDYMPDDDVMLPAIRPVGDGEATSPWLGVLIVAAIVGLVVAVAVAGGRG